jgi:hypothetical protein
MPCDLRQTSRALWKAATNCGLAKPHSIFYLIEIVKQKSGGWSQNSEIRRAGRACCDSLIGLFFILSSDS